MKGYWHFPAISAAVCAVTVMTQTYWFAVAFIVWLLLLYGFKRLGMLPIVVSLTVFFLFYTYIPVISDVEIEPEATADSASYTGKIIGSFNKTDKKIGFVLQDHTSKTNLLVVYFPDKDDNEWVHHIQTWKHGATCEVYGKMEQPTRSTNPGQFDYRRYLQTKGIMYQINMKSMEDISCSGSGTLAGVYDLRQKLIHHVKRLVGKETAAWLTALVIGDDSSIDEDTIDLFQRWGLSHILAISGLHVGLIVSIVYFLFIKCNLLTKEKAQWVMIIFLPFYALIAGGEPSVWRACVMLMLFIILNKLKVQFGSTDVLSIVFLLLMLADKYMVYHVGFQFSFLVTFGILLSRHWLSYTSSPLLQMLQISFVAQMIIFPLQVVYFYMFHPLSIILNLLVIPYFTLFVIPFMFFLLLLSPILGAMTSVADIFFTKIHHLFLSLLHGIDTYFYHPLTVGSISVVGALLYFILFLLFMNRLQQKRHWHSLLLGCLTVCLIIGVTIKPYFNPVGSVTMLDIGQGDAFVIELPYRKGVFMVDAGAKASFDNKDNADQNYRQMMKPYFMSRGITTIDAIFLSHEDFDHVGSVPYLIDELNVKYVIVSAYYPLTEQEITNWQENGTDVQQIEAGETTEMAGQVFSALSPFTKQDSPNDNSLVLYTEFGGLTWLFTGDIGQDVEQQLIRAYPDLNVDVLKVAHHGSKTSSDSAFLSAIDPVYGLISVGRHNLYGHPSPEITERLAENDIYVFRSDQDGAVVFRFHEDKGTFLKFLP